MFKDIKIYASDKYWQHIFANLGAVITDSKNTADVVFDDIDINAPISVADLQSIIFNCSNNQDIITNIFGHYVILPKLQHKILVALYKNPNISMQKLKELLGVLPDVTPHTVENAVYQLRKNYGHDFIQNTDGKYKIGRI